MIIKISDIPAEGRDVEFGLNLKTLQSRVSPEEGSEPHAPDYRFIGQPSASVHLTLEGNSVRVRGVTEGDYQTSCARCAEETTKSLKVPLQVVLKPHTERGKESEVEDLSLGYYDEDEVDCGALAEEYLILALPYTVYCREDCLGVCPECGANRNSAPCKCAEQAKGDDRFAILRGLKAESLKLN